MSNSLRHYGVYTSRLPCTLVSPRVCLNSCPLSQWCHLTISSSVTLFFSCPQSFPTLVFSNELALCITWPKYWISVSVFPMNIQDWFPLGLTGLISLQSKELSRIFSSTTVEKHQFFGAQPSLWSNSHILTWQLENPQAWLYGPCWQSDVSDF